MSIFSTVIQYTTVAYNMILNTIREEESWIDYELKAYDRVKGRFS